MNATSTIEAGPLAKLREQFPANQISKLPKETKAQTEARKNNREGVNCTVCGGWHHPRATHLDYVGHAALTDRLLDTDPQWTWEPVAFDQNGLPALDRNGGLWIKLTVCGVTRFGYGSADGKNGGDAVKELIGDALRNAAMRFGAALDLWHKGDLHAEDEEAAATPRADPTPPAKPTTITEADRDAIQKLADEAKVKVASICKRAGVQNLMELTPDAANSVVKKLRLTIEQRKPTTVEDILEDSIPY